MLCMEEVSIDFCMCGLKKISVQSLSQKMDELVDLGDIQEKVFGQIKYDEHSDDHQMQVASVLDKEGYLHCIVDMDHLLEGIQMLKKHPIEKRYHKPSEVISIIEQYISNNMKKT